MQPNATVVATRYLGSIYDFMMLNVLGDTHTARGAINYASEILNKTLRAIQLYNKCIRTI